MKAENAETSAQLLPGDRSFYGLLLPYFAPYLIYVALSSIPETIVPVETAQGIKLLATGAALLYFRKTYRFGSLKPLHGLIAILALPVALVAWIGPFYALKMFGITDVITAVDLQPVSLLTFWLRVINSVVLVAAFRRAVHAGLRNGMVLSSRAATAGERPDPINRRHAGSASSSLGRASFEHLFRGRGNPRFCRRPSNPRVPLGSALFSFYHLAVQENRKSVGLYYCPRLDQSDDCAACQIWWDGVAVVMVVQAAQAIGEGRREKKLFYSLVGPVKFALLSPAVNCTG